MYNALIWLLAVELLGLIALPLTYGLFKRLPDRGLVLSKLLALLVSSYALWVLGLAHVLPNSRYSIAGILAVLALASCLVIRRRLPEMVSFLRKERLPLLASELVFVAMYLMWVAVVYHTPAINHTEKPMDFAFLNSILKSTYFPPEDPWLAGHSISYYYFGHFMMALLSKLTAIPSSVSYNLSIALLPALVGAGAFSLVYNLVRLTGARAKAALLFALAAPLFVAFVGNLEGVLEFAYARGWGSDGFWQWVSIKGLGSSQGSSSSILPEGHWWWWRATRVIDTVRDGASLDYTITEFPFFSFILGDLHPHVASLPFMVLNLALGLNLLISRRKMGLSWLVSHPWEAGAITLSLGALAFINIWDFPVFALLLALIVLLKGYRDWGGDVPHALLSSSVFLVPVLAAAVVLYLPFYLTLSSQASGILPTRDAMSTRPLFFFLIWGLFLVSSGYFLLSQLPSLRGVNAKSASTLGFALAVVLLPFVLWAGIKVVVSPFEGGALDALGTVGTRLGKLTPGMAMAVVALYSLLLRAKEGEDMGAAFPLLLLAVSFYLLVGAELFYLVDLFGTRMNTVFKAYYQSWLLLAIVSACALYYGCSNPLPSPSRFYGRLPQGTRGVTQRLVDASRVAAPYAWLGLVGVATLASLYYPVGAALDRTEGSGGGTLDGLAYLKKEDPREYEAIRWLRDDAPPGRIVEAVGDDYSDHGRISSSTGLPTILGWKGHEHQWRGSTRSFDGREEDVEQIYRGNDATQVRRLLDAYDVRYVYVGPRERARYGPGQLDGFGSFLKPVFREGNVLIYERVPMAEADLVEREDGGPG